MYQQAATQQFNGMITLNEVAAFIWKNLDESKSKEELVDKIMDEFEVDEETARTECRKEFSSEHFIETWTGY